MGRTLARNLAAGVVLLTVLGAARPSSRAAASPHPATRPVPTAALRGVALGPNAARADEALAALELGRDAGSRDALAQILPQLVSRDAADVGRAAAAVGDPARRRADEGEMEAARREAWDNLAAFGARGRGGAKPVDAVQAAHRHHDRLAAVAARLRPVYAAQVELAETVARRVSRVERWRRLDPATARLAVDDSDRLAGLAEAALGMPPELAIGFPPSRLEPPKDADRRGLWHFLTCRRIEAYNRAAEPLLDPQEVAHAAPLNAYRELLGLLPLELDARLVQSARRHSREMIDLWYFSHYSPTDAVRTWNDRMRAAGYDRPADENIHLGRFEGPASFWSLFDSPGHHWAMVRPRYTTLGVGRWDMAWTEHFGDGPRLMLATPADRAAARVVGDVLAPQQPAARRQLRLEDYRRLKAYDRWGREVPLEAARPAASPASR